MKKKKTVGGWTPLSVLGLCLVILFAVVCAAPFLYMFLMSFTQSKTPALRLADIDFTDFSNYIQVFTRNGFFRATLNSCVVVIGSCVLNCVISSMAAYGFEKKNFPGKEALFQIYLLTLMIPGQVTMIPVFIMMDQMHLLNTYTSLIITIVNAFGVFLIRQFMKGVPDELLESAQIDGCPEYRIFIQIVIPLIKPVLVSLVIFTFVNSWNSFLWPLIATTSSEMYTLTVSLSLLKLLDVSNFGLIMAGASISFLVPFVLYLFLQRQFVEGIALSGIKG